MMSRRFAVASSVPGGAPLRPEPCAPEHREEIRVNLARTPVQTILALALVASQAAPALPQDVTAADSAAREWNQPRGGPAGTSAADVAPVRSAPVEVWRKTFRSLACEPVSWGGVVYLAAAEGKGRKLFAFDLKSGEAVAKPAVIEDGGAITIAVWQGTVAVVGHTGIAFFSQRGDQLMPRDKRVKGLFPSAPCVYDGLLFAAGSDRVLHCIDIPAQKEIGFTRAGFGQPAAIAGERLGEVILATTSFGQPPPPDSAHVIIGTYLALDLSRALDIGTKSFRMESQPAQYSGRFHKDEPGDMHDAFAARVQAASPKEEGTWFVYSPGALNTTDGALRHTVMMPHRLSPIETSAAVYHDFAIGFSSDGALIRFGADGKHYFVIPKGTALPPGARPGAATIARDVLYLANWAVEIESGRVLWCDPSIEATTPLIPVADGCILYGTAKGELVCMKDPSDVASATVGVTASAAKVNAKTPRPIAPGSGDALVLEDGRRIAGAVTQNADGGWHVAPAKGDALDVGASDVALIENGGEVRLTGEENSVYLAFLNALREDHLDALQKLIESWRDSGFPEECQRLINETKDWGMNEARAAALTRTLTGKTGNKHENADKQRARIQGDEDKARERSSSAFVRACDWAREHGARLAASALLSRAARLVPKQKIVAEKAAALIPPGFPEPKSEDAPLRWMNLAEALLPVSGVLVAPDDAAWNRAKTAPWNEGAFGVRTKNLMLFSRERDPEVIASCLANGERTVQVLDRLLGPSQRATGEPSPNGSPPDERGSRSPARLDIRLHKNRAEYLAEVAQNKLPMEWTAGYYSPLENISRFYVPRDEKHEDPLERNLEHVLVHELTHHYICARWLGLAEREAKDNPPSAGDGSAPGDDKAEGSARRAVTGNGLRAGFWVVEGFARFIEDQVVEMDRRGERFDDDTVMSIDAACHLAADKKLIPLEVLLDLSHESFFALTSKPVATVQLRNTIARFGVTGKSVFYEEGGSLVFYLMNKAGEEKRAALIDYLRSWYASKLKRKSWEALGYASAADLEKPFTEFLDEIARR